MIEVLTLGRLEIRLQTTGTPVVISQPKRAALLAYLAVAEPRGLQRRDTLLALLWPDLDQAKARAALNQVLYLLRHSLGVGDDVIVSSGEGEVGLDWEQVQCDAVTLREALTGGRWEDALAVYRGPLLAGFHVSGTPEFERWLDTERARLHEQVSEAAWSLAEVETDPTRAARLARQAAAFSPEDETIARRLISFLIDRNDRAGAFRVYRAFADHLRREYGTEPSQETHALIADLETTGETPALGGQATDASESSVAVAWPDSIRAPTPEKKPADRWQTAEELLPQLEALTTASDGVTTDTRPVAGLISLRRRPTQAILITGILVVAGAITVLLLRGRTPASELDPDLLAVAPFDVIGSGLETWGEGLSDILSHSLDGAGPLRTVSPSLVVRRWSGRADPTSAAQLGTSVGAGLVVYGRLVASGGDSVRLTATLLDVASENVIGDTEVRSHRDHVDRLADSLTVRLLGELSRIRRLGAAQLRSLGSSSPAALKAFLRGEQHYRRLVLDSAQVYYGRAIELDTTFALAYSRMGSVAWWGWTRAGSYTELWIRAGALNRGLSVRESLLVAADSIYAAVETSFAPDSTTWAMLRRLLATLERADRSYPGDPQIQHRIGEARLHFPLPRLPEPLLESFARAVELDSTFAPAYVHLIQLQATLQDIDGARQSIAAYLALGPSGATAEGTRILDAVLDPARAMSPEAELLLDTASIEALQQALFGVNRLRDSAETGIRVGRAYYETASSSSDSARARVRLGSTLAFRGHLQEATELISERGDGSFRDRYVFTELALLGAVPPEQAAEVFGTWLESEAQRLPAGQISNGQHRLPMPWWARVGDTASIKRAGAFYESHIASDTLSRSDLGWASWAITKANFYLALARRDTTEALRLAERFPEYTCSFGCYYQRLTKAQLLAASGRDREAARLLDEGSNNFLYFKVPGDVIWRLERARVHERLGNTDKAIGDYAFVADVWRHADERLQPLVTESREALQRLPGERRQ